MRITGGEEGHALSKVENAYFRNNPFSEINIIDIIACFLGEEDIGICKFEGLGEGGLSFVWAGLGKCGVWIKMVEKETSF